MTPSVPQYAVLAVFTIATQLDPSQLPQPTLQCETAWSEATGSYCVARDYTLGAPADRLTVDTGGNGLIRVRSWTRSDVAVRARAQTWSASESDARLLASAIDLAVEPDRVAVNAAPKGTGSWAVSFELWVPSRSNLNLLTQDGTIEVDGIRGETRLRARNGTLRLNDPGGYVTGETETGNVHLVLAGERWDGAGVDLRTGKGNVRILIPDSYSARVEAATVLGRVRSDFPTDAANGPGRVTLTLGTGGATLRAVTNIGMVHVSRLR